MGVALVCLGWRCGKQQQLVVVVVVVVVVVIIFVKYTQSDFTISFSVFFYSLDVFSLFHRLFFFKNNLNLRNVWLPPGIEPRTACLTLSKWS